MISPRLRGLPAGGFCLRQQLVWLVLAVSIQSVIGPRPSAAPRNRDDLEQGRVLQTTAALRRQLLDAFVDWIQNQEASATGARPFASLARETPIVVTELLEEYGRVLYETGASRRTFAETINVVQQKFPFLRRMMTGPWQLATTWESLHPSQMHPPIPKPLLEAMVSISISWKWHRLALLLLLGFYALLRPAELFFLKVKHFVLSDLTGLDSVVLIQLLQTKTRTRGARFQSVRLEEPRVIVFLQKCLSFMTQNELLWPLSPALFRTRFDQVLTRACGISKLVCPSSLRPGGATFLFQLWKEDIQKLQWRGRWLHMKTMLHYIQELGAVNIFDKLEPAQKSRVLLLAQLLPEALANCVVVVDTFSLVAAFANAGS